MSNKLYITRDMLISLVNNDGDSIKMFDSDITTNWFPGWNNLYYPAVLIIDLQGIYQLSNIRLYDGMGAPQFKLSVGLDCFNTTELINITLDKYNTWREFSVNIQASFIIIQLPTVKTFSPNELEFYGDLISTNIIQNISFKEQNNINGIFGINSFHWIPNNLLTPFKFIREYQYWQWMEGTINKYTFEPTRSGAGNFDTHYKEMKDQGFIVVPCINQCPAWFNTNSDLNFNSDWKPILPGVNSQDPASYIEYGKFLFQLSARYGNNIISDDLLSVDSIPFWNKSPINIKKSGLALLEYIEVWNEPDKTWKGPNAYFSPFEFAAMMSAAYDGHCGTLGPNVGIKTANPDMKVVMGGLARLSTDYIKAMYVWFKHYRKDSQFASDVINVHHYSNSLDIQSSSSNSFGISPEDDNLDTKLEVVKTYVNTYLPEKEFWLSEYGYDTNLSTQSVPLKTTSLVNQEQIQASWLSRSMLSIAKANLDKAFLYLISDQSISTNGLYSQSGIVNIKPDYKKKIAWSHLNHLKSILRDYIFDSFTSDNTGTIVYSFTKNSTQRCLVVYNIKGFAQYDLVITNNQIINISKCSDPVVSLNYQNFSEYINKITLNIDENPLFIELINNV